MTKFHLLIAFTSWDIEQYVYCNCFFSWNKKHFSSPVKGVQLPKIASDLYSAPLEPEPKSKISYLSHKHKLWPAFCGDNEYQWNT